MKFLTTIIGIMPVLCAVAPASAALSTIDRSASSSGRISVSPSVNVTSTAGMAAARRLPTLLKNTSGTATTTSSATSDSALMDEVECVEKYTECIKAPDVCDFNFEECTTTELFYAKKPQCNSVLLQCSAAGINTLFGTNNITNLSAKNSEEEYMYPTAGSVLGQFIEAGAISNRLDTSSCVKRYTSCLNKDNVCGDDFELCTTNSEFKKQKIYCESTLARCQEPGIKELFGWTDTSRDPSSTSRLGVMITEGAALAAANAVSTCYKVADQCVLSACGTNPYKCMENSSSVLSEAADAINDGRTLTPEQAQAMANARTKSDIAKYVRNACYDTIGGNKYCYMTVKQDSNPSAIDLIDEENRDEVYTDIISSTMTRVSGQLEKILDKFDKRAKDTCSSTIAACAMRSCGSGLGSACYYKVFGSGDTCFKGTGASQTLQVPRSGSGSTVSCSVNGPATYDEIKLGCEAIVNTDANCQYAAAYETAKGYNYSYSDETSFDVLFPEQSNEKDPLGVIASLNASLAAKYSNAAIEQMGKECKTTAVSCIRSLCGTDFVNCYRNRTDVMADAYATDVADFDNSMNKVGGVLDFNIVRGLCVDMVKNSDSCEEHLKIQQIKKYKDKNGNTGWGDTQTTVRDTWVDASKTGYNKVGSADTQVLMGCVVKSGNTTNTGLMGRDSGSVCDSKAGNPNYIEDCGYVDSDGCIYSEEYYMKETDYQFSMTVNTLFQEVLADLELEAQAKYNSKLTAEQHKCIEGNSGGLMGNRDMSSTYMWVKLKSKRTPKNYSTAGLNVNDFVASNDLYGSFCRARVTIQSDDPDIQAILQKKNQNWSTAYFAVGDVFTCGSWIPQKSLEEIANRVACKKAVAKGTLPSNTDCTNGASVDDIKLTTGQKWATVAATIGGAGLGGVGGAYLADTVQSSNMLGGLIQRTRNSDSQNNRNAANAKSCKNAYDSYISDTGDETKVQSMLMFASGIVFTNKAQKVDSATQQFDTARKAAQQCVTSATAGTVYSTCGEELKALGSACELVSNNDGQLADYDNNQRRQAINLGSAVTGAAALGTVGYLATSRNIKAANRQKFTEDEQEFMDNIGEHIYCFIGADEAGTYGDLIEISVE